MGQIQYLSSNLDVLSAEVRVPSTGIASYKEMVEFAKYTIEQNTEVHDNTAAGSLAEAIVQSILNRMRIGF